MKTESPNIPVILDEAAVEEIEAEIAQRNDDGAMNSACGEYNCYCHYRLPALCATVRALRAQLQTKATVVISDIAKERDALREQLAEAQQERREALQAGLDRLGEIQKLQSRLAQVEKELAAASAPKDREGEGES